MHRLVREAHLIGRLDIEAVVSDLDMAMALRPRVETLCWRLMPRVLERVCHAMAPQGFHLRLGRLDLNLGFFEPEHLEEDALARLEASFSEALTGAIVAARHNPSDQVRLVASAEARLEHFERYLVNGIIPLFSRSEPFDPLAQLLVLADEQPEALVAMLRRRAHDQHVLERLVLQLGEKGVIRLLSLLAPADAAVILGLLVDIVTVHRTERPPELDQMTEPVLHQLVWVTSLEFLLRDAGSQFNRRRLLRFLLERAARRTGIAYAALLQLLAVATERAARRAALRSSLPRTLVELLNELQRADALPPPADPDEPPSEGAVEMLVGLARRNAADLPRLEALFGHLAATAFDAVLRRLEPAQAAWILAGLDELAALHAAFPVLPHDRFDRLVRLSCLAYLANPGRTGFDAGALWHAVLAGIARRGSVSPSDLARIVRRGLADGGSFPRLSRLAAVADMERGDGAGRWGAAEPAGAEGSGALLDLIRSRPADVEGIGVLVGNAPPETLRDLVGRLRPADGGPILACLDLLAALQADGELLPLDPARFERLALTMTISHLAGLQDAAFDQGELVRHLVAQLARRGGMAAADLAASVAEGVAGQHGAAADAIRAALSPLLAEASAATERRRELVEGFLRAGRPRDAGAALVEMLAEESDWLAERIAQAAREAPDRVPALARTLLDWLLPQEILNLLGPEQALAGAAPDTAAGELAGIVALLRGEQPAAGPPPHGPGPRLDRNALVAHWLECGMVAPWAPPGITVAEVLAVIPDLSVAELTASFPAEGVERVTDRLTRAAAILGRERALRCMNRIAPWLGGKFPPSARLGSRAEDFAAPPPIRKAAAFPAFDPTRLFAWLDGTEDGRGDTAALARQFAALADRDDPGLRDYLAANRERAAARARWAAILPPEALGRLVDLLVPAGSRGLADSVMLIGAAWRYTAPFGARRPEPQLLWSSLLDQIATPRPVDLARVLDGLMDSLTQGNVAQKAKLRARARHLAQEGGYVAIRTALRRTRPAAPAAPARPAGKRPPGPGPKTQAAATVPDHAIFIGNAGLILFNPYLPMFFERLGLLSPEDARSPRRDGIEPASRAVHLLQYLADGRLDAPEPELVLNKLLCGQPCAYPVERSLSPSQGDLDLCDGLIAAVIANWPVMHNTSAAGLRETFLQREGKLRHVDGKWMLRVQRKTLDVLADQIPWSFGTIYHKWMKDPIHVTW